MSPADSVDCRVTVVNTGESFTCGPDELILDAGLRAGLALPHNCRGGACGTCKSQILEGEVDHGWVMSFAISDEEKAEGKCLICQSKPCSERLVIRTDNPMSASEEPPPAPVQVTGTVVANEAVTPSIRRLVVALPEDVRFRYRAGMHVEIMTEGVGKPRTYSIATPPDEHGVAPNGLLEFFVTRHESGKASGWLHALRPGMPLTVHGPYGTFALPKEVAGPVLCLAGGSGLAPILAIVAEALANGLSEPIEIVLSVRDRTEIFALDRLYVLGRRYPNFQHMVTTTRADAGAPDGWRSGRVSTWLGQVHPDLADHAVLIAGPPGFVDACTEAVQALGALAQRILTDSFTATPDG